jgi:hypothetical protein
MKRSRTLNSGQDVATLTRRTMLGALLGLVWAGPRLGASLAQTPTPGERDPSQDMISFEWELPRSYADRTARYLGVGPDRISPAPGADADRGGPVILIIVAIVLLVTLARSIVAAYRDFRYGGIIVEDTPRGLRIRHDRRIPGHVVIIKDRNGVTIRELRGDDVNVQDLVPLLARTSAAQSS